MNFREDALQFSAPQVSALLGSSSPFSRPLCALTQLSGTQFPTSPHTTITARLRNSFPSLG